MISTRLRNLLDQHRIPFEPVPHDPAFTAQHLAARMHVPGREFAKAVVVRLDDRYAIAALPAHRRVDEQALARAAGAARCTLASEAEFRQLFPDCELGAMPPVGNLYGLATYVDEELTRDESVVINAGSHADAVRLRYADLARLAKPTVGRFAVPTERAPGRKAPARGRAAGRKPARKTKARKQASGKKSTATRKRKSRPAARRRKASARSKPARKTARRSKRRR